MPSLNPNHRQVMAAKHVGGRRTRYSIEGVRGLVLDITARGIRTWYVRYQVPNGTRVRFATIGSATRNRSASAKR